MAFTLLFLLQLLSVASASHYYRGKATFTYKGRNPDGTLKVDIRNRATFDGCPASQYWSCYKGNRGSSVRNQRGVLDRSTNSPKYNNQWCESETVNTRNVRSDKPFQMRAASWRLLTFVDLGTRSDTRQPNRPPDVAILPFLRAPQNCPRTYKLISFDPDGDRVRCRYGNIKYVECYACSQPSGFHLDQDSCTLHYQNSSADPRVHGFEMVVEDFPQESITLTYIDGTQSHRAPPTKRRKRQAPTTTTTTAPTTTNAPTTTTTTAPTTTTATAPLSKLPLQFSLFVDPPAPSCEEGQYLPKYVHPTPDNGERIQAEVDKEVEIRVKAQASYATIHDMIISGPLNISTHKTTHDEFVIRWTPTSDDLGDHFPVCFAVESVTGSAVTSFQTTQHHHHHHHATPSSQSGIYQSEMRCVILDVVKEQIKTNVICTESTMTVEVDKSSLPGLHEDHLRLTDSTNIACNFSSNSTHFYAVIPLNACGTQIEEDEENLSFKNEITTVDNSNDLITRKHLLEVEFYCQYPKRGNATLAFTAHRRNVTVWEKGFGTFMYQFEFYPDNQYQTMIDPGSYPLEYDLGSRIYMQIEATSSVNNTELFVESCRAAPYDNPNYQPTYSIIEDGCKADPTVELYSPEHKTQFKFSIEAFKFISLHDQVYISCSVLMCEAGNPNTRCSKGCMNSPWRARLRHHHRKREAVTQSSTHLVSQGPLRLKRSAELTGSPVMNLNLNLVFVAGCLLAAVGMISAVVMYKAKMSRVKYQPLPTFES